jgi:hypothetical protein
VGTDTAVVTEDALRLSEGAAIAATAGLRAGGAVPAGREAHGRDASAAASSTPAARRMSPNWVTSSSSRVRADWRTNASRLLRHSRYVAGTNR